MVSRTCTFVDEKINEEKKLFDSFGRSAVNEASSLSENISLHLSPNANSAGIHASSRCTGS